MNRPVLLHLAAGVGDIVLATPLIAALDRLGHDVELLLHADYPATAELFEDWAAVRAIHAGPAAAARLRAGEYQAAVPAIPPFYWPRFRRLYAGVRGVVARPPDRLFYQDVQVWYLAFARALGFPAGRHPGVRLPIAPDRRYGVGGATVVLAPGCKTGVMAAKRWPGFAELARRFDDVAVVGTADDLRAGGRTLDLPPRARSFVDRLSLRQTAELMAAAGAVVANDSGLGHVAAAVGVPTLLIFGPTPDRTLGPLPPNVRVLRSGLPCEPCWLTARLAACGGAATCLLRLETDTVERAVREILGTTRSATPRARTGGAPTPPPAAARPPAPAPDAPRPQPVVSCVMPTADRRAFVPTAIARFLAQDFAPRELIILDDGADAVADLVPRDPRIRYVRLEPGRSLGDKRNLGCQMARGELIAHWDDDDWMADWRLSYQVNALRNATHDVCGLNSLVFFEPATGRAWRYRYRGRRAWVAGGTLLYRRTLWQRRPFAHVDEGEDSRFVWGTAPDRVLPLPDDRFYVAFIHAANTSPKRTGGSRWQAIPSAEAHDRMHDRARAAADMAARPSPSGTHG